MYSFKTVIMKKDTHLSLVRVIALTHLIPAGIYAQTTVLHYSVNDTDEATVTGGTVPGAGTSPDGTVAFGTLTLSDDVPTEGVPAESGNRSMVFSLTQAVNVPGTQQLSNEAVVEAGGFTYEIWFKWDGLGNLNALIDYAGTEKFRMNSSGILDFNFDSGSGPQELSTEVTVDEWHYAAIVFTHDGEPIDEVSLQISGTMTWYFDSNEPVDTVPVTKDDFGDSLNRTIAVGGHPLGFGADFASGLIYEPRVSLGALEVNELLYGGSSGEELEISSLVYDANPADPTVSLTWNSRGGKNYVIEYSRDLNSWDEIDDAYPSGGDETTFSHHFLPDFEDLVGAERLFYRVGEAE